MLMLMLIVSINGVDLLLSRMYVLFNCIPYPFPSPPAVFFASCPRLSSRLVRVLARSLCRACDARVVLLVYVLTNVSTR